ncbi:MAG: hypothetical protein JXD21_00045 [Candidatus Omnitrophica bacterium]|nr:hypothetical protein [Candidatus Omnitrophota bacterium]
MFLEIKTHDSQLKFDLFETEDLPLDSIHSPKEGVKIRYEGTMVVPTIRFPETIFIDLEIESGHIDEFARWFTEKINGQEIQLKIDSEEVKINPADIEDALKKKIIVG